MELIDWKLELECPFSECVHNYNDDYCVIDINDNHPMFEHKGFDEESGMPLLGCRSFLKRIKQNG